MAPDRLRALGDLALCAAVAAGAATLMIGAAILPPPRFDPLGSAAVPRILAVLMLLLAAIIAARAIMTLYAAIPKISPEAMHDGPSAARPMRSVAVFAALIAYVAALDMLRVPLIPASTVFMGLVGFIMSGNRLRQGAIYAAFGFGLSILMHLVMTRFLYVSFG